MKKPGFAACNNYDMTGEQTTLLLLAILGRRVLRNDGEILLPGYLPDDINWEKARKTSLSRVGHFVLNTVH
jgi:hypothetical protein